MARIALLVAALLTLQSVAAADPGLQLTAPRLRARRELWVALALGVAGTALVVAGSTVVSRHGEGEPAGIGVAVGGSALALASLHTTMYGAGHRAGLADGSDLDALDAADGRARRLEHAGMGLFFGGLALFAGGAALAFTNLDLRFADESNSSPSHGNAGLFWLGFAASLIGDASWFSGSLMWSWGAGERRGIREARAALTLSPAGVSGTF